LHSFLYFDIVNLNRWLLYCLYVNILNRWLLYLSLLVQQKWRYHPKWNFRSIPSYSQIPYCDIDLQCTWQSLKSCCFLKCKNQTQFIDINMYTLKTINVHSSVLMFIIVSLYFNNVAHVQLCKVAELTVLFNAPNSLPDSTASYLCVSNAPANTCVKCMCESSCMHVCILTHTRGLWHCQKPFIWYIS